MTSRRQLRRWEADVRCLAYDNARQLAVAIVAGAAVQPPPYDLGIILQPGEVVWHRAPAFYSWRGTESWIVQNTSYWGYRTVAREVTADQMYSIGMTDWLVTSLRLVTRAPDGEGISIYWAAITGLTVALAAELVILDGPDRFHGELTGPAIAPIAVAAIAVCHGPRALLDHPGLAPLRSGPPAA